MSRAQENQEFNTANTENTANYNTSQKAQSDESADIGQYQSALSKFAASNPYVQGGQAATTANNIASGTAGGAAAGTAAALQDQAKRTGQNPDAANATTASADQSAERDVAAQEAEANQNRIGDEAQYNQGVLSATGKGAAMSDALARTSGDAAEGELGEASKAGSTPSWLDEFGNALGGSLGLGLGKGATSWAFGELPTGQNQDDDSNS